jgi:ribonuclease HI
MRIYYTDGSASPNPGPGGFAVLLDGKPVILGSEPDNKSTTNIRMEGFALINALKHASGEQCEIWTDSEFWVNVITKWAPSWEKNGWKKRNGEISNLDIVQEVYSLYKKSNAKLVWIRGHNHHELNELADHWANEARKKHLS